MKMLRTLEEKIVKKKKKYCSRVPLEIKHIIKTDLFSLFPEDRADADRRLV